MFFEGIGNAEGCLRQRARFPARVTCLYALDAALDLTNVVEIIDEADAICRPELFSQLPPEPNS